ncbi:unnamed protein product [Lampetra fluviatilis]
MTIALFGQLMVVSSNHDFAIDGNAPEGGYKHIKYPKSFRASLMQTYTVADKVNMMATFYVDVSNKYLMNTVSGLGRLIALDDPNERQGELKKLTEYCKAAQKGIVETAKLKKRDFDEKCRKRQQSIEYQQQFGN